MTQSVRNSARNIKKVSYQETSPTPTPTPPPNSSNSYRGKKFVLPEPELTYHGIQHKLGKTYNMARDGGYKFYLFEICEFRKVADQSQIAGITKTDAGIGRDVILMEECPLWWWFGIGMKYGTDLIRIGVVSQAFFDKLKYKNYQCIYKVNAKLYHQTIDFAAKRTPQPIPSVILQLDPDTHAGQNGLEYKIKITSKRRKNGKSIHGGWTTEWYLDPQSKSWTVPETDLELQIARKAAKFNNRHYVDNYMRLKNVPLDLLYTSPFWGKPEKYEEFKNIGLKGFNGIFCKDMLYKLMKRVFDQYCNHKKFNGYIFDIVINHTGNKIYLYGEDINEYLCHFGLLPFVSGIKSQNEYDDDYIVITLKKKIMKDQFNLILIKQNGDGGEYTLNGDVVIKYHRGLSRIFVHKFSFKLEGRHFIKAKKNGTIK